MFLPPHRYLERLREYESLKRRYDQEVLGPQQFLEEEEQEAKVDTMEIECTAETVNTHDTTGEGSHAATPHPQRHHTACRPMCVHCNAPLSDTDRLLPLRLCVLWHMQIHDAMRHLFRSGELIASNAECTSGSEVVVLLLQTPACQKDHDLYLRSISKVRLAHPLSRLTHTHPSSSHLTLPHDIHPTGQVSLPRPLDQVTYLRQLRGLQNVPSATKGILPAAGQPALMGRSACIVWQDRRGNYPER